MGWIRLYNVGVGRWVWYYRTDGIPKTRTGRKLKRVAVSLRNTWRRITGDTADRTYYTFSPSSLTFVDERTQRRHDRLVRGVVRRERRRTPLRAAARAVLSVVEMQEKIH